jgi:2-oxoisovalerate dehydrogenase E2 component (dihydrolipoyl transacylase)
MLEVDVSSIVKYRQDLREEFKQREGVDLTYLPFVIKAVVESLEKHPMLNSTWGGDKIVLKKQFHIGIAVATPEGLVVPVIHDAASLGISGLAKAVAELSNKARQGKLSLPDVQGGTFTVNNTGALGSIVSQPIINYPQAGILTTEAVQKRPVVVHDAIAIRSMMNICLSFDHRIVDGSESGAFLQSVKRLLEDMGPDTPV